MEIARRITKVLRSVIWRVRIVARLTQNGAKEQRDTIHGELATKRLVHGKLMVSQNSEGLLLTKLSQAI